MGGIVDSVTSIFSGPPDVPNPTDTIEAQKRASRLNQSTPYGNINFGTMNEAGEFTPSSNYETVQMNLSPEQEYLRNQRLDLAKQFGNMGAPTASTEYLQFALPNVGQFVGNLGDVGSSGDVMSSLAAGGNIGSVGSGLPQIDYNYGAQNQRAADAVFQRGQNYLDPIMQQQTEASAADLAARGIPVGSEAYTDATGNLRRDQGQQLENLALSAVGAGNQEAGRLFGQTLAGRGQQFGEQATTFGLAEGQNMQDFTQGMTALSFDEQQRQNRMNEQMQALQGALAKQGFIGGLEGQRAGLAAQLSQEPQNFVNVPGVDASNAIQDSYAQEQQRYQQNVGDVTNLAGNIRGSSFNPMAALSGLPWSDVRLKKDIELVDNVGGHNVYEFSYKWGDTRYRGVMAQEIAETTPDAVHITDSGFYQVDYGKLPVSMERV